MGRIKEWLNRDAVKELIRFCIVGVLCTALDSAIFYTVPDKYQLYFMLNPIYTYIRYFRIVVLDGRIPTLEHHIACVAYAVLFFAIGCWMYKKHNHRFLYYL